MSSVVRTYEVAAKVVYTNGTQELCTRTEHAYNPVDAVMQAILNISADKGAATIQRTELVGVSVPRKLILESEAGLLDDVTRVVKALSERQEESE